MKEAVYMHLSDSIVRQEFSNIEVQDILQTINQKMKVDFTPKLKGWGGQGLIIYLESDLCKDGLCAKIPHFGQYGGEEAKHAILKEAQINEILTKCGANFAPKLVEYSRDGSFLVREYIKGEILYDIIKKATYEERIALAYREWGMATEIFSLFHENTQQQYVIRDFKAKNIIASSRGGHLFMIDFGSCRREDNMVSRRRLKMMQRLGSGKFLHWPLEQLLEDREKCSRKVDYFAFGVLLYETIFNTSPYTNCIKEPSIAKEKYNQEYLRARENIVLAEKKNQLPAELAHIMEITLIPEVRERSFSILK